MATLSVDPFAGAYQFPFEITLRMVDPDGDLRSLTVQGGQVVPVAAIDDEPRGLDSVADMLADAAADAMREAVKRIREQPVTAQTAQIQAPGGSP